MARQLDAFAQCLIRSGMSEEGFVGALTSTSLSRLQAWTLSDLERLLSASLRHDLDPSSGREIFMVPDSAGGAPLLVVSVDGWSRILNSHPQFAGMQFKESEQLEDGLPAWIECTLHRWDRRVPTKVREYLGEVRGLSQAWITHPRRMLRHKAMIQCARVTFGLSDIVDADEASRIIDARETQGALKPHGRHHFASAQREPMGVQELSAALGV
jgi:hypothetical protein